VRLSPIGEAVVLLIVRQASQTHAVNPNDVQLDFSVLCRIAGCGRASARRTATADSDFMGASIEKCDGAAIRNWMVSLSKCCRTACDDSQQVQRVCKGCDASKGARRGDGRRRYVEGMDLLQKLQGNRKSQGISAFSERGDSCSPLRCMARHFRELTCWQLARSLKREVTKLLKKANIRPEFAIP
jgi:hypothetical protein